MFTAHYPFKDFFIPAIVSGILMSLSILLPLHKLWTFTPDIWLLCTAGFCLVSLAFVYHQIFVSDLRVTHLIFNGLAGILCVSPFTLQADLWTTTIFPGKLSIGGWQDYISTIYASLVLITCVIGGYVEARHHSSTETIRLGKSTVWWLNTVDFKCMVHGEFTAFSRCKRLIVIYAVLGLLLLCSLTFNPEFAQSEHQNLLLLRGATFLVAVLTLIPFGIGIGEAIRLYELERQMGRGGFVLRDFDARLKWRHDYVKYHLPTPIRALNLRLFNQHIEAYEHYCQQQKPQANPS